MSTLPKALRLADALDELDRQFSRNGLCGDAAAELRRLALKQWVGLTLNEAEDFYDKYTDRAELINAIDKFLEEKNA